MINKGKSFLLGSNKFTLVYALVTILPIVGFAPHLPSIFLYAITLLYASYCLYNVGRFDLLTILLLFYIPFELVLVQPPTIFKSWSRYIFFTLLLINVSPLLQSRTLRQYRQKLFTLVMWVCVFLGVGSFFAYFLGLNYMQVVYDDSILSQAGLFGGLTTHSMMLGPIAGVSTCYLAFKTLQSKKNWGWIFVALSLFSVLFTASRSALVATIAGLIITIYHSSETTSKFIKYVILALIISTVTFSIWDGALTGVLEKNGSSTELNYDSRTKLWIDRLDEFYENPIFGVGFCAIDINANYSYDVTTGRLETGTSWLSVFSMLGIVGGALVISIFLRAFIFAKQSLNCSKGVLLGLLTLFFVHMFAEGYIFAGGSFLAFLFWLSIGVSTDTKYEKIK